MPSAPEEINAKAGLVRRGPSRSSSSSKQGLSPTRDAWLDEIDAEVPDYVVPKHEPKPKPCSHNQQMVVNGAVCCAKCGLKLVQGGVVGDPQRERQRGNPRRVGRQLSWRDAAANLT